FRILSLTTFYSLAIYMCLLGLWFSQAMDILTSQPSFDYLVNRLSVITYFLLVFSLPFTIWRETRGFVIYMNNWRQFELQFSQTTNRTLKLNVRKRSVILLVFSITFSFILETTYIILKRNFNVSRWLNNIYQTTLRYLLGSLFYLLCFAQVRAAISVLRYFKLILVEYRVLWLRLSRLTQQVGTCFCYTFGFYILYLFLNLTLCLYLSCAYTRKIKDIIINTETSFTSVLLLYVMCDAGHAVNAQVTGAFQEELLNMRNEPGHPDLIKEVRTCLYYMIFLQKINLITNLIHLKKSIFFQLTSALVTYLIVLLQFQFQ
ncbi:hypothetical protein L9F63_019645, partial [Diploptera punctata]